MMEGQRNLRGRLRLGAVFSTCGLLLIVLTPLQIAALFAQRAGFKGAGGWIPVFFHRCLLRLFGIRWHIDGKFSRHRPLLIVANHLSWLDIIVLGAVAPLSFVAKADMKHWPLFGQLAQLQRTIFVKREERRGAKRQASEIAERMTAREIIVLFPEGTTGDGHQLLPFKTPLFEAAKLALSASPVDEAMVQPVALSYTRLHGLPLGRGWRHHIAWPGEIGLGESLMPVVRKGALDVVIRIAPPLPLTENSNRKVVAALAADEIRDRLLEV